MCVWVVFLFLRNNGASVNQGYHLCLSFLKAYSLITTPRVLVIGVDGLKLRRMTCLFR